MLIDMIGKTIGSLTVLEHDTSVRTGRKRTRWLCQCICGKKISVSADSLRAKKSQQSCGCVTKNLLGDLTRTHGARQGRNFTPEYRSWSSAKSRCFDAKCDKYSQYGGRGITMCSEWKNSFSVFIKDMGIKEKGLTLERIDVNGNYEKSNCKWVDRKEQAQNRRNTIYITYGEESITIREAATRLNIGYKRACYLLVTKKLTFKSVLEGATK